MTRELLMSFHTEISSRQVPLAGLKKDPFVFVPPMRSEPPRAAGPDKAIGNQQQDSEAATLGLMQARLAKLRVQSIMTGHGSSATAIISNHLVTAGQKIDGFTVKSIASKTVVLGWKDKSFTLKMQ